MGDPITTLLFLYGLYYAIKNGVGALKSASRSAKSGGRSSSKGSSKSGGYRSGNHANTGWWAREIGHGFPTFRDGVAEGWHDNTRAAHQRLAGRKDRAERRLSFREEKRQHKAAIKGIREKRQERRRQEREAKQPPGPVMAPPASSGSNGSKPASKPAASKPPLAKGCKNGCKDGEPHDPDICPWGGDPEPPEGTGAPDSQPAGGTPKNSTPPKQTGDGSMPKGAADTTYEQTNAKCDEISQRVEVSNAEIGDIQQMTDGLGAVLPGDADTLGAAGDLSSAVREWQAAGVRVQESAANLKAKNTEKHGAAHDAAQSAGVLAEQSYHEVPG